MKVIVQNGKILVHNGKIVVGDECCDPCAKWWCVLGDNGETSCVQSATQPVGTLSGPHDKQAICEAVCSEFVWWCVFRNGVRQCVISDTEPIDKVPGTTGYPDSITCAAFCSGGDWWCVNNGGTLTCIQQPTRPPNAINVVPYTSQPECEAVCSRSCGIFVGFVDVSNSIYACREWFDDCTGGAENSCTGWVLPQAGYFMDQWDPPGVWEPSPTDPSYNTRAYASPEFGIDMYAHKPPGQGGAMIVRAGLTAKNSNRGFPDCEGVQFAIIVPDPRAPSVNVPFVAVALESRPRFNDPDQSFNQYEIVGMFGLFTGTLPDAPRDGDRIEVSLTFFAPSIAVGDVEYKTTYHLNAVRLYRRNVILWDWSPPGGLGYAIARFAPPLCYGHIGGGGTYLQGYFAGGIEPGGPPAQYYEDYFPTACDDIYWDIQTG